MLPMLSLLQPAEGHCRVRALDRVLILLKLLL
jgi:hypothetical protein